MSDVLRITTPMVPKNYTAPGMRQPPASEQFIDIANLSKVIKTTDKSDTGKQDVNEFQSKEPLAELTRLLRDPSMGAQALKNLLSEDMLAALAKLSNANLGKQLSDLVNNVFINSDFLAAEIADQQKFMSVFKGEIFDYMRAILDAAPGSEEVKQAVGNFLKAVVSERSQGEMLRAVSANLENLAKEMAPLKELSANLLALSHAFRTADDPAVIPKLRAAMFAQFSEISSSILMDSKVERMMSLTIYNLSKYNPNPNLIRSSFEALLTIFSEEGFQNSLREVLNQYLGSKPPQEMPTRSPFEAILPGSGHPLGEGDDLLQAELEAFQKAISKAPPQKGAPEAPITTPLAQAGTPAAAENPADDAVLASLLSKLMSQEDATKLALELVDVPEKGESAAKADGEKSTLQNALSKSLSDKESTSLQAKAAEPGVTKSVLNLVDMLKENLSNPLLRSMTGNDVTNLLRSLLVAPNSAASILHFVLPAREGTARSFGELWVDPDPERGNTTREERDSVHMLLSAEIPQVGSFEIELYSKGKIVSVLLLCPPEYTKEFSTLKNTVAQTVSSLGFSMQNMRVGGLVRKRNLMEVFPTVYESKAGFNVKV